VVDACLYLGGHNDGDGRITLSLMRDGKAVFDVVSATSSGRDVVILFADGKQIERDDTWSLSGQFRLRLAFNPDAVSVRIIKSDGGTVSKRFQFQALPVPTGLRLSLKTDQWGPTIGSVAVWAKED
jgi:hypothetical protein